MWYHAGQLTRHAWPTPASKILIIPDNLVTVGFLCLDPEMAETDMEENFKAFNK